ncbi:type IV toxin-antitoxin system AbiEi family antitoxin domain-containing protein [Nocardioides sp. CFH 31398]|uniref:type IV toxin-antitoxin system AbiEi family antitoxin domain-containing protein n=1 Tax=Nocardioides sp. CFH 31398 TaxID=2919579 RepID=UPI001F0697CE|nr:type IV toxin-antitoxin system AbiEi family antitoxin domain-containing protein [Nocardioides sp. CFH 31398]MCH1867316.1 type IV toxin-antitoxin system AbiEi family antitoxin domain-containing protein [Nocardioides sp. CFH 31398]
MQDGLSTGRERESSETAPRWRRLSGVPDRSLPPDLVRLLTHQDGVVTRRQAEDHGLRPHDIARLLRRKEWARLWRGVYVDHTGRPTWRQRAWAAVLSCWPAALDGASALRPVERLHQDDDAPVFVAIDRSRTRPVAPPGVIIRQVSGFEDGVQWNASPPRRRYEEAIIDIAADADDDLAAVEVLVAACRSRRTTPQRLAVALDMRRCVARRAWMMSVLDDAAHGTHSVLEHGYLHLVERAHGLPTGRRQRRRDGTRVAYEDVGYDGGAVVELDGFAFHSSTRQRHADLARDLEHAAAGGATVRLDHRHVYAEHCATAVAVAAFLTARGVPVAAHGCGPGCPLERGDRGRSGESQPRAELPST